MPLTHNHTPLVGLGPTIGGLGSVPATHPTRHCRVAPRCDLARPERDLATHLKRLEGNRGSKQALKALIPEVS